MGRGLPSADGGLSPFVPAEAGTQVGLAEWQVLLGCPLGGGHERACGSDVSEAVILRQGEAATGGSFSARHGPIHEPERAAGKRLTYRTVGGK